MSETQETEYTVIGDIRNDLNLVRTGRMTSRKMVEQQDYSGAMKKMESARSSLKMIDGYLFFANMSRHSSDEEINFIKLAKASAREAYELAEKLVGVE
jgi:hypothetical protein